MIRKYFDKLDKPYKEIARELGINYERFHSHVSGKRGVKPYIGMRYVEYLNRKGIEVKLEDLYK